MGGGAEQQQQQQLPFMHYTLRERLAAARRSARSVTAAPPPNIDTSAQATDCSALPGSPTPTALAGGSGSSIRGFRIPTPVAPVTLGGCTPRTPRTLSGGITPRTSSSTPTAGAHQSTPRARAARFFSFPSPSVQSPAATAGSGLARRRSATGPSSRRSSPPPWSRCHLSSCQWGRCRMPLHRWQPCMCLHRMEEECHRWDQYNPQPQHNQCSQ